MSTSEEELKIKGIIYGYLESKGISTIVIQSDFHQNYVEPTLELIKHSNHQAVASAIKRVEGKLPKKIVNPAHENKEFAHAYNTAISEVQSIIDDLKREE